MDKVICKQCGKSSSKYGIKNHISIVHEGKINRVSHQGGRKKAWNKGLTKTSDTRIASLSMKISKTLKGRKHKPHTGESKKNLREHAIKNKLGGHTSKKRIYYLMKNNDFVYLQSSYEVEVAKQLDANNIMWIRPKPLLWIDDNNMEHRYYPDFYLIDYNVYLDTKNDYLIKKDKKKIESVCKQQNVRILVLSVDMLSWNRINAALA